MMLGSEAGSIIDPSQIQGEFQDFIGVYRKFVSKQLCLQAIQEFELLCNANEQCLPEAGKHLISLISTQALCFQEFELVH